MSGSRLLIVNADDFGRSPGINLGIVRSHREGIVSSTTLMINLPWAAEAVQQAKASPRLGIGLHANLCYGRPVSDPRSIPTLVDDRGLLIAKTECIALQSDLREIERELTAQYDLFRSSLGREPTHIDSHKYLHSVPRIAPLFGAFAAERGLPIRATSAVDREVFRATGARTTDAFLGSFHGLDGSGAGLPVLLNELDRVEDGTTELMCHPGYVDELIADSSYRDDREVELEALCSQQAHEKIDQLGVQLASFNEL